MKKIVLAAALASSVVLAACSTSDPTSSGADGGEAGDSGTIVIGTANFPESDIIGNIYAEALSEAGFDVEVNSGIGSREVYTGALEEGSVDVFPEYVGSLGAFYDADIPEGADSAAVARTTADALPEGLALGDLAPGQNSDSFHVLPATAEEYDLTTLGDLQNMDTIRWAANPEIEQRPFNAEGLERVYGVSADKIEYNFISDSGGPLSVTALRDGVVDVASVFSTSPSYDSEGNIVETVALADPEGLILPENIVPVYRADALPQEAVDVLNEINAELTTEQLLAFNDRNLGAEKASPEAIAQDFVAERS